MTSVTDLCYSVRCSSQKHDTNRWSPEDTDEAMRRRQIPRWVAAYSNGGSVVALGCFPEEPATLKAGRHEAAQLDGKSLPKTLAIILFTLSRFLCRQCF